jgi:RNA polymerase sigma-70 factor (ECF subfamily)
MWPLWASVAERSGSPRPLAHRGEEPAVDREAVRRMAAGDREALAALYDRHGRSVFSFVLRIVGEWPDAEDVVQDVFAQAWRQASRYDEHRSSVAGWLLMIARTRAIDALRARRSRPDAGQLVNERTIEDLPGRGQSPDLLALRSEEIRALRAALDELPLVQRLAIELAFYEGFTQAEIAERLEQPLGTVKTRIRLGLLKLRDVLSGMRR